MIEPDAYIDEYYRQNQEYISKPPNNKYSNLNFSRLTADRKLVQVTISILINQKLQVKDRIDWDLGEEKKSPQLFANKLVDGLEGVIEKSLIDYNKRNIKNQILDQLLDHVEKNTFFPRLRLIKKENDASQNSQLCMNCNTVIYNPEYCVNCMFVFEKKIEKKPNINIVDEENRQTERQRMIELRQKNVNVDDIAVSYTQEGKEKKICKKCGEVNVVIATECKNCKFKFPLISYFDIHMNQNYSVHFWDKINKNSIVQQLKNFGDFFSQEDFCSLKYLYNKILTTLHSEFEEILTEEAYADLRSYLAKTYFAFSNPTLTTDKVFDSAYYTKFSKQRPRNKMLNFNSLSDIKEGWLPDNLPDKNVEEIKEEKVKTVDPMLKRKRGRPKKIEIFKTDINKENETQITISERDNLLKTDLIADDDMHYDFCGRCDDDGKLICCETCSSAYHYECLGYEKFPRGKFKCYFCKIVKVGIDDAVTVDKTQMKLIKKLITYNRKAKWQIKAQEFLDVIKEHHCSSFFKSPVPSDYTEFYEKVKEPRDLTLVEIKLTHKEYSSLKDFIQDLYLVWANFKCFYQSNSFFYKQANTMEIFMTHLIKEEGVFDTFEPESGNNTNKNFKESGDEFSVIIETEDKK